jgi:hypothetical protein
MNARSARRHQSKVDGFNRLVKVGGEVAYCDDVGKIILTRTRSEASVLGGHTAVVWLVCKAGCVALDRVRPFVDERAP